MSDKSNGGVHPEIRVALEALRSGKIGRRQFLQMAGGFGLSMGMANAVSLAFTNDAYAMSSKDGKLDKGEYDYIIVGAGSSGAALAGQLAQLSDASVLVLEAGGTYDRPEIADPRQWPTTLAAPYVKNFNTEPQSHIGGRSVAWPRAYAIGGCSDINAMIYCRGHRSDYDNWAYEGCVGWDWKSVLPAYKALEDWEGGASEYRGVGGPLHVTQPQPGKRHPGAQLFINAAAALGHEPNPDFNGPRMEGPAWVNFTISGMTRQSTGLAFLKPAMARKNLTVVTDAPTEKLLVENGRCTGVQYNHGGKSTTIRAAREVIVCAGALESPRLLLLSGIGPADQLKALGIDVKLDLPGVGENLHDHILGAGFNYEAKDKVPVSNYNHSEVYMWGKSDPAYTAPDYNILYLSVPFSTPDLPLSVSNAYSIVPGLQRPYSRGSIKLTSADPKVDPAIDPNYLSTEQDWKAFTKAAEIAREIGAHSAFAPVRKREVLPGDTVKTPAQMREFLSKATSTFFHPVGTCKMGLDAASVVDPQLKVYGIEGLRVADASVMPSITSGNTNAPSILIGWRGAEIIAGRSASA